MFYICIIGEGFFPYPVTDGITLKRNINGKNTSLIV